MAQITRRTFVKGMADILAILAGHEHFTMQDRFSPTATEYVVGGNFFFHGEEWMFI